MRRLRSAVALVLAAALVALPVAVAEAVGTGDPVIQSPASGAAHYSGFTGPFVVDFEDAPIGVYSYYVEKGGAKVGATRTYDNPGFGADPQLRVSALPAGTGYTFHVTFDDENGTHQDTLGFTVLPGAAPRCSIVLPAKVRMKARSHVLTATLSPQCQTLRTTYAAWEARHPVGGFAQTFIFSGSRTDRWRIYDDELTGTYTVRPNSAKNTANETVPQNTAQVTVKMDSRIRLTAKRSGTYVTLRTTSKRYSPSANRFVVWGKRPVVLSYRTCSTCAWKKLKVRTSDRYGVTSYRVKASKTRTYRATAPGTSKTWAPGPDRARR